MRTMCPTKETPSPLSHPLCRGALSVALALALGGCAAWSPPAQLASTAPVASTSVNPLAQWWQRFNDPLLGTLVTQALQANTSIRSAQAALQQSRALRDVSAAGLLPTLSASGSAQRGRVNGMDASNSFHAGLDASWEPDIFDAQRSTLNAAEADTQALQATLADVQVSVAAEVALAYVQLRGQQAQLVIARNNLASQQETLQLTQWRQQAGLVTELEAEQARAAVEQTRALLPALQISIAQTGHALAVLTGQPPEALSSLLAASRPVPQAKDDPALGIPAETLRQRADVRAAEYLVSAARARVAQADAARFPGFALGGTLGLSAASVGALSNGAALVSSLLASVTLPIFDGGAAVAQVRSQQAALEQARIAYHATILNALKEVEDALVALHNDRQRLLSLRNAADAAGNAALMARQRFSSGLVDFQVVLETQRAQFATQDSVASASADLSSDFVRLFKALGGGWSPATTSTAMAPVAGSAPAYPDHTSRTSTP